MNILSMFSIIIATAIVVVTLLSVKLEYKAKIKPWLCLVELSLSWWCIGYAMFYTAIEKETAWFWHRFSSIGWSTFAAFTAMYFIIYTGQEKKYSGKSKRIAFFVTPVILLIKNMFGDETCVITDLTQSSSGLGWTYISNLKSPWYWFYILQLVVYFTIAFSELFRYRKKAKYKMKKELAINFAILDALVLGIGIVTDFILPHFTTFLPPLSIIAIGIFQIGYFRFIYRYDMFNIDNVISSRNILETSTNPILLLDDTSEILRCNSATCRVFGYEKKYIIGKQLKHFFPSGQYDADLVRNLFETKEQYNIETRLLNKNGMTKDVLLSATIAEDKRNEFLGIVISINDVTELLQIQRELKNSKEEYKKLADKLYRSSYYDQLTQLPNRRMLYEVLEKYKMDYDEKKTGLAVIYLDLDGFKDVNDSYGHETGDQVLVIAARRLENAIEKNCFVARMGGDEFICVISDYDIQKRLQEVIEQINMQFGKAIVINNNICDVGVSIGYSIYAGSQGMDELIRKADDVMYQEKHKRKK